MKETTKQMERWGGEFGKEYTDRNTMTSKELDGLYFKNIGVSRTQLNKKFLDGLKIKNILEVGSNIGLQLLNLHGLGHRNLVGIELQEYAINKSKELTKNKDIYIIKGSGFDIPFKKQFFDLVFTSGVLIHISPKDINKILDEIYRCSKRYIFGYEYYSDDYEEVEYRGNKELLWKTNFAKLFLERFPDLRLVKEEKYPYLSDPSKVDQVYLLESIG